MRTERLAFSCWDADDLPLARELWGNPDVARYICAAGVFTEGEISERLAAEVANAEAHGMQYWPVFEVDGGAFVGCCGLRPHAEGQPEAGVHLLPAFWGRGYAREAMSAAIGWAFTDLGAESVFAGHNPANGASRRMLLSLGFEHTGDEFYAPTGLMHPSYVLCRVAWQSRGACLLGIA